MADLDTKGIRWAGGLVAVGLWALWLHALWLPERQWPLHQEHLLKALPGRNWKSFGGFLADDYADPRGWSKTGTPRRAGEVWASFTSLTVPAAPPEVALSGVITHRLGLAGSGDPVAERAVELVNSLTRPFVCTWVHRSGRPWDWQWWRVAQPELHLDSPREF